jgi:hypothetical protein
MLHQRAWKPLPGRAQLPLPPLPLEAPAGWRNPCMLSFINTQEDPWMKPKPYKTISKLPSGNLTSLLKMATYSEFSH